MEQRGSGQEEPGLLRWLRWLFVVTHFPIVDDEGELK